MYPVTLVTVPACGETYFVTSLLSVVALSTFVPGVVTPKVDAFETVIVIGELVAETPWLSVTLRTAWYVPDVVYVNDGFATVESPKVPSPLRSQE
jgi:hypothetical protein